VSAGYRRPVSGGRAIVCAGTTRGRDLSDAAGGVSLWLACSQLPDVAPGLNQVAAAAPEADQLGADVRGDPGLLVVSTVSTDR
jgi:hypothetical protein